MGLLRGTLAVVVILVKGHAFPTIVNVLPLGCDPLAIVDKFTPVEDNIGLLETTFNEYTVLTFLFPEDVTGSINLTRLVLFIGVTSISLSPKSLMQGQTEMMKLVVEIECVGMNVDEFDKDTGSSDGLQPKQADLSCIHVLNEPHLRKIHVVLSKHEADQHPLCANP
uniref:Uncharacterized protein n=1 Tax=Tanacetum cinerariifolium TaxID=118510 RepID=A0A699I0C4_TANCI|nr:hypothetical protein [Tanacetum cinerariifolium]